ncbi:hypothetical protein V8C42DRAFT_45196 [Trichoderma barbatum]
MSVLAFPLLCPTLLCIFFPHTSVPTKAHHITSTPANPLSCQYEPVQFEPFVLALALPVPASLSSKLFKVTRKRRRKRQRRGEQTTKKDKNLAIDSPFLCSPKSPQMNRYYPPSSSTLHNA